MTDIINEVVKEMVEKIRNFVSDDEREFFNSKLMNMILCDFKTNMKNA